MSFLLRGYMNKQYTLTITDQTDGERVKDILSGILGLSRRDISRLLHERAIFVNEETCPLSAVVHSGDVLKIDFTSIPYMYFLLIKTPEVLYEDENLLIVNKPFGLPSHASKEHPDDHMGTIVSYYFKTKENIRTIGRLDKDASGIMVYAKNKQASVYYQEKIHKEYMAIAEGRFDQKQGTITYALGKAKGKRGSSFQDDGKECITHYEVMRESSEYTLLKVWIDTGRKHQIRAGFAGFHHPLAGDRLYQGSPLMERVALHCSSVSWIDRKTKEIKTIQCELPEDMQKFINAYFE